MLPYKALKAIKKEVKSMNCEKCGGVLRIIAMSSDYTTKPAAHSCNCLCEKCLKEYIYDSTTGALKKTTHRNFPVPNALHEYTIFNERFKDSLK